MRQLLVEVARGKGNQVLELAASYDAVNSVQVEASNSQDKKDLVIVHIANKSVGGLINDLQELPGMHVTLLPQDAMPMTPPEAKVADAIRHVTQRSPVEVWLNGLQSVGSWKGFLGYTVAATIVVWTGMFTGSLFLLVAAMLIAPFAGPAMNTALASASGDRDLLQRNLLRYFVALSITILLSAIISLMYGQTTASTTMTDVSELSAVALVLPLTAGAAGALNLVQAQNSSLVAGTAVGTLIAAALAPPAGLIGMAIAIGRWSMAMNGVFTLLMQLFAINLSGAIVFRLYGLRPSGPRYDRGRMLIFYASVTISAAALILMVLLQFSNPPSLQRSTRAQQAVDVVHQVVDNSQFVELVEANMRFTRPSEEQQETLLGIIYVQRLEGVDDPDDQISRALTNAIQYELLQQGFRVTPLIAVTVLDPPSVVVPTPTPASLLP